jgi:hypothetical protein
MPSGFKTPAGALRLSAMPLKLPQMRIGVCGSWPIAAFINQHGVAKDKTNENTRLQ